MRAVVLVCVSVAFSAFFSIAGGACGAATCGGTSAPEVTRETLHGHATRKLAFWGGAVPEGPLQDRFQERLAPELVEYLALDNAFQGFPQRPRAAELTPEFARDIRAALASLPARVHELAGEKLLAIGFVEEMGGTAYTESVSDANGEPVAGYMLFDVQVLERTANTWATYKESSPYVLGDGQAITATLEHPDTDDRMHALRFILLHELGHIVAIGSSLTPGWEKAPFPAEGYPFFAESWRYSDGDGTERAASYVSRFDAAFPERTKVRYYAEPDARAPAAIAEAVFDALPATNFITPYGATNPGDDFAEAFATYVHTVLEGRPWSIELRNGGERVRRLELCWGTPRCAGKEALLGALVGARKAPAPAAPDP